MPSCDKCGKHFDSKASVNAHQVAHSDKYREGIKNRDLSGENNPAYSGGKATLECEECGKDFDVTPARKDTARFCSRDCEYTWKSVEYKERGMGDRLPRLFGEDNPNYGRDFTGKNSPKWKEFPTKECLACEEEFEVKPSREHIAKCCSRECQNEWMSKEWKKLGFGDSLPVMKGPENPRWKGGYDPYYGPNWSEQRKNVLKRDNHSCRRCGKNQKELGRDPDVHHIEPLRKFKEDDEIKWSVANSKDNLVSLCKSCHIKIENMPLKPQFNT